MGNALGQPVAERGAHRLDGAAMTLRPHFVTGGIDILVDPRRHLRMRGAGVVALAEIVGHELPVGVQCYPVPGHAHRRVHRVIAIDLGHRREIVGQAGTFRIHAVPHEAAPGVATQFLEAQLAAGVALGEIGPVLRMLQHAVQAIAPAVIRAVDAGHRRTLCDQPHAAMRTGIIEGADRSVVLADAHHRFLEEIMHQEVAGFRDFGSAPGDMPDARPQPVPFLLRELPRVIALAGNRIAAQQRRIAPAERLCCLRALAHHSSFRIAIHAAGSLGSSPAARN